MVMRIGCLNNALSYRQELDRELQQQDSVRGGLVAVAAHMHNLENCVFLQLDRRLDRILQRGVTVVTSEKRTMSCSSKCIVVLTVRLGRLYCSTGQY